MRHAILAIGLVCSIGPACAQSESTAPSGPYRNDAKLNELRAAPEPKKQNDIDTLQLASAHRERAESVEEKTTGLWQSWTTSICEGCGNTPSYRKTVADDFANRRAALSGRSGATATSETPRRVPRDRPEGYGRRLYSDLSPETVGQIRRMPRQ